MKTQQILMGAALLASGLSIPTDGYAMFHPASAPCQIQVSKLLWNGNPLSYESAAQLKDAYKSVHRSRTVYTPLLPLPDGRQSHFAIERDGCARMITSRMYYAEPLARVRGAGLR